MTYDVTSCVRLARHSGTARGAGLSKAGTLVSDSHIQLSNSSRTCGACHRPYSSRRRVRRRLFCPSAKAREMARQVAQPLFVLCRAPSRERGRLMARHRGRLPYSAGPRFTGAVRFPAGLRILGEAHGGRSAPGGHAPGGRLVVAAGRSSGAARVREKRSLPAAGAASGPTRMTPHESALWRTERH